MNIRTRVLKKVIRSIFFLKVASLATGKKTGDIDSFFKSTLKPRAEEALPDLELTIATLATKGGLAVVQVGANDGKTDDPVFSLIHQYATRALLIEPQPWLIPELRANYARFDGNILIENIAIGNEEGELGLYILRRDRWDEYIAKVGRHPSAIFSPDRNQLLHRIVPRLSLSEDSAEAAIERISTRVERLEKVLDRHDLSDADVVQIDCEGWDFEVIKSLGKIQPPIINFESFNLSDEIWREFVLWSDTNGYGFIRGRKDTLAIRGLSHKVTL